MAMDEYGNYYPDETPDWSQYGLSNIDPYGINAPEYGPDNFDWSSINWQDPAVLTAMGLNPQDFIADTPQDWQYLAGGQPDATGMVNRGTPTQGGIFKQTGLGAGAFGNPAYQGPAGMTAEGAPLGGGGLYLGGEEGGDVDPQSAAGQATSKVLQDAVANGYLPPEAANDPSMWSKVSDALTSGASKFGSAVWDQAMKNPLSTLATLVGGGAALAGLFSPGAQPLKAPDLSSNPQLGPEAQKFAGYIGSQAGREEELAQQQLPIQKGILDATGSMLPGIGALGQQETAARGQALGNIQTAQQQIADELGTGYAPTLEAQRMADERRKAFEKQQLEALGTGYTTSEPYNRAKAFEEQAIREGLEKSGLTAKGQKLSTLGQVTGGTAGLAPYQGLDMTARTLGQLAATAQSAAPQGAAERGLSAITGTQDRQQSLLNSIAQFNAQLQQQKNADLYKFGGTLLGGGLYGLTQPRTTAV